MRRRAPPLMHTDQHLDEMVWETYAVEYLWVNLGFSPNEQFVSTVFVSNQSPPGVYACAILRAQGLEFVYTIDHLHPVDEERFKRRWLKFAHEQPSMAREVLDLGVAQSRAFASAHLLVQAMVDKGFVIEERLRQKFAAPVPGVAPSAERLPPLDPKDVS